MEDYMDDGVLFSEAHLGGRRIQGTPSPEPVKHQRVETQRVEPMCIEFTRRIRRSSRDEKIDDRRYIAPNPKDRRSRSGASSSRLARTEYTSYSSDHSHDESPPQDRTKEKADVTRHAEKPEKEKDSWSSRVTTMIGGTGGRSSAKEHGKKQYDGKGKGKAKETA